MMEQRLLAEVAGRIASIHVQAGEHVQRDQVIVVIEAMKMEFEFCAPRDGRVAAVLVQVDDVVEEDQLLVTLVASPIQGVER